MLGIVEIASYLPIERISNYDLKEKFNLEDDFIVGKIGIKQRARKDVNERASDLAQKAFESLMKKVDLDKKEIDCCIVVTQNPDYNIPHTSAILHGKLGLQQECACFDIALGCSGYVYGLSNILAFMQSNGLKNGLLFTSDPYSDIINHEDKNTELIFGDGATVTYISENPKYIAKYFSFGTNGAAYKEILCDNKLYMNGRSVFNFTATTIPPHIKMFLEKHGLGDNDISKYILHQGSKYIVDTIRKRLKIDVNKVPFDIYEYGNTVSSSVPMMLEKELYDKSNNQLLLSAYGIGLSWGSVILERVNFNKG